MKPWTTLSELAYLETIGTSHKEVVRRTTRKEMLTRYIKSSQRRVDWGALDKDEVLFNAKRLLTNCE